MGEGQGCGIVGYFHLVTGLQGDTTLSSDMRGQAGYPYLEVWSPLQEGDETLIRDRPAPGDVQLLQVRTTPPNHHQS